MSAQIIAALRERSRQLSAKAAELDSETTADPVDAAAKFAVVDQARWLASEYQALADLAETL